jgi:hypothetical protein
MVWLPWLFRWDVSGHSSLACKRMMANIARIMRVLACVCQNTAARFRPNHSVPLAFASFAIIGGLAVMALIGI